MVRDLLCDPIGLVDASLRREALQSLASCLFDAPLLNLAMAERYARLPEIRDIGGDFA